jgi:dTDP-glucose 4,6-dehydratase
MQVVMTICDLVERMQASTHGPRRRLITFVPDRPGHDRRYAIDATKIEHELGWRAIETFETGLEKTVRWHLDNRPWWQAILDRGYKAKRIGCRASNGGSSQHGQVIGSVMWTGFLSKRDGFMASR